MNTKKFGDIATSAKGKKPDYIKKESSNELIPYVDIQGFEEREFRKYTNGKGCRLCEDGDLLMVWDGSRSGLVGKAPAGAIGSTLAKIELDGITNEYGYYFLRSHYQYLNTNPKGSGTPHVDPDLLWNLEIRVPPIEDQHRIVEKIEELFSELDNGVENLKKARQQLKTYRQAVLKDAFEGKLTKEWREQQDDLPTPEELLQQIKAERKAHRQRELAKWEKEVEQWEKDGKPGKKPKKPRKALKLNPFTSEELYNLGDLPKNWKWVKIDQVINHDQYALKAGPFGSALKKEFYVEDGYKVYGQEQVIGGSHKIGDYYIDDEKFKELNSCKVSPRDILISLVGTVGKVLILPEEIKPGVINPRLVKISVNEDYYLPELFKYFFESAYLKSIYATKAHGATMDILNSSIIKELPFPLVSKKEQKIVLTEIESRLSVVDQLEQTIKENLQKAEALRQSILKKAFGGELVGD